MTDNPYYRRFADCVSGNMIEHYGMESVRQLVVDDVYQLASEMDFHSREVEALEVRARSSVLLPNGYWSDTPAGDLYAQAANLRMQYEEQDTNARQELFEKIYEAACGIAEMGVYEYVDNTVLGPASLMTRQVTELLASKFGAAYEEFQSSCRGRSKKAAPRFEERRDEEEERRRRKIREAAGNAHEKYQEHVERERKAAAQGDKSAMLLAGIGLSPEDLDFLKHLSE